MTKETIIEKFNKAGVYIKPSPCLLSNKGMINVIFDDNTIKFFVSYEAAYDWCDSRNLLTPIGL